MTLSGILAVIGLAIAGIFTMLFEASKSGEKKIINKQNEIENEQLKEQIEGIEEWKRTNDHIDSLGPDDLASKLQAWSRAERKDH